MRARTVRVRIAPAVLCALLAAAPHADAAQPDRDDAEAALQDVAERLNDLSVWFSGAERKRIQWQKDVQAKDREVAALSAEVDQAERALAEVRSELAALAAEQQRLQARRAEQARHIADHLAAAYRMSGEDFIKLVLNQQSPETFDRMIRYHRYFSRARSRTLDEYRQTLAALEANSAAARQRAEEGERRRRALAAEQTALEAQREERKALLARLQSEAESRTAERERLQADQTRLESLMSELQRRAETLDGRGFAERRGSLPWPLVGTVRHAFGQKRAGGRMAWHGLLVEAEQGTTVRAVFRGRVIFADWLRGFGLLTIVDHGSGYMTLYGHADALSKRVGDWVEGGEVIAVAGRSGGQTTTGLYFEIRHEGQPRDPVGWLTKR